MVPRRQRKARQSFVASSFLGILQGSQRRTDTTSGQSSTAGDKASSRQLGRWSNNPLGVNNKRPPPTNRRWHPLSRVAAGRESYLFLCSTRVGITPGTKQYLTRTEEEVTQASQGCSLPCTGRRIDPTAASITRPENIREGTVALGGTEEAAAARVLTGVL